MEKTNMIVLMVNTIEASLHTLCYKIKAHPRHHFGDDTSRVPDSDSFLG